MCLNDQICHTHLLINAEILEFNQVESLKHIVSNTKNDQVQLSDTDSKFNVYDFVLYPFYVNIINNNCKKLRGNSSFFLFEAFNMLYYELADNHQKTQVMVNINTWGGLSFLHWFKLSEAQFKEEQRYYEKLVLEEHKDFDNTPIQPTSTAIDKTNYIKFQPQFTMEKQAQITEMINNQIQVVDVGNIIFDYYAPFDYSHWVLYTSYNEGHNRFTKYVISQFGCRLQ